MDLSEFDLKCLLTLISKCPSPKFKVSVWNFSISEIDSKCNWLFRPADSNWVITMELKRKVQYITVHTVGHAL